MKPTARLKKPRPGPPRRASRITGLLYTSDQRAGVVCDRPRDGESGRRGRRRRVPHVQGAAGAREDEVVDEAAVAAERLRPHARRPVDDVGWLELRHEPRRRAYEASAAHGVAELGEAG